MMVVPSRSISLILCGLVLTYEGTEVIGHGVKRGFTTVENMTNARNVLKKDGEGNYILTGYPN